MIFHAIFKRTNNTNELIANHSASIHTTQHPILKHDKLPTRRNVYHLLHTIFTDVTNSINPLNATGVNMHQVHMLTENYGNERVTYPITNLFI